MTANRTNLCLVERERERTKQRQMKYSMIIIIIIITERMTFLPEEIQRKLLLICNFFLVNNKNTVLYGMRGF